MNAFSFQGVSDEVASGYIRNHGNVTWADIARALAHSPSCPLLRSYWHFSGCQYNKTSFCCSEPEHLETCTLPGHALRNGRLNQTAYSFFLFVRDIAKSDLVQWIDDQLSDNYVHDASGAPALRTADRLLNPLRNIYGVSDKILTMSLSCLLLGTRSDRPRWFDAGATMIAVDTLVHNFLQRTGVLGDFGVPHLYGPGCYAKGGCAEIIRSLSAVIDARQFNPAFPQDFPRFVQNAIWRFCAADHSDICNGNRIDDRKSCNVSYCQLTGLCSRKPLKMSVKSTISGRKITLEI